MYRVRNTKTNEWVKENIYMSPLPNCDLYIAKKGMFGSTKLELVSDKDYVWQRYIGINDMDNVMIYEGDYLQCKLNDGSYCTGMVAYTEALCSFVVLFEDSNKYIGLNENVSDLIRVVGNVFDGVKESTYE